jgi:glycosyltransferase involved in cell wall biosynthesis
MTFEIDARVAKRRRVLAVGPGEGFVTGQSTAFLTYVRRSRHLISVVNTNDEGMSFASHVASSLSVIIKSAFEITFRKPDCLYISTSRSKLGAIKDVAVIALARLRGVPVVNHLHGITFASFRDSLGRLYGALVDWAYGYIAVSIVLHEKLIGQYARYPAMNIVVVNNFVEEEMTRVFKERRKAGGTVNVLFLSNLMPEKGIFELIDSVKSLLGRRPGEIRLKIAGRYLPGAGLSSRAVETRFLENIAGVSQIEYCGFANSAEKKNLLEWADVLALPSYMREEGIPLVVLEGMAAGCYLIVSDFGILPYLVQDVTAAVVPARNTQALERALAEVLGNRELLHQANTGNPPVARARYTEAQYVSSVDGTVDAYIVDELH